MSIDNVRERRGLPNLARKLRAGEAVHIVAYGTSLTNHAYYLGPLRERLAARFPNAHVRITNVGLKGFTSELAAFRVEHDVRPLAPDLVILEFAHNDVTRVERITAGLDGILAQILDAHPSCDVLFLYFALRGMAVDGPTEAALVHEEVAARYGIPSIDLSGYTEKLVASGAATWSDGERALTTDGVHHAPLTAELLGVPFAEATVRILDMSSVEAVVSRAVVEPSPYERARRVGLASHLVDGPWSVAPVSAELDAISVVQAYVDTVCEAEAPGASLRVHFSGRGAMLWTLTLGGEFEATIDGRVESIPVPPRDDNLRWMPLSLRSVERLDRFNHLINLDDGPHVLEIRAYTAPLVLGDLFILGELTE